MANKEINVKDLNKVTGGEDLGAKKWCECCQSYQDMKVERKTYETPKGQMEVTRIICKNCNYVVDETSNCLW